MTPHVASDVTDQRHPGVVVIRSLPLPPSGSKSSGSAAAAYVHPRGCGGVVGGSVGSGGVGDVGDVGDVGVGVVGVEG